MSKYLVLGASAFALLAAGGVQAAPLNEILSADAVELICGEHESGVFAARVELEDGTVLEGDLSCGSPDQVREQHADVDDDVNEPDGANNDRDDREVAVDEPDHEPEGDGEPEPDGGGEPV